ncbi:hypothetical protein Pen01_50800 [Phytomonospora endophytica]|nr:hypothetical protein Pen01_50800 [Phytomonospora endophytica]
MTDDMDVRAPRASTGPRFSAGGGADLPAGSGAGPNIEGLQLRQAQPGSPRVRNGYEARTTTHESRERT